MQALSYVSIKQSLLCTGSHDVQSLIPIQFSSSAGLQQHGIKQQLMELLLCKRPRLLSANYQTTSFRRSFRLRDVQQAEPCSLVGLFWALVSGSAVSIANAVVRQSAAVNFLGQVEAQHHCYDSRCSDKVREASTVWANPWSRDFRRGTETVKALLRNRVLCRGRSSDHGRAKSRQGDAGGDVAYIVAFPSRCPPRLCSLVDAG